MFVYFTLQMILGSDSPYDKKESQSFLRDVFSSFLTHAAGFCSVIVVKWLPARLNTVYSLQRFKGLFLQVSLRVTGHIVLGSVAG